MDSTRRSPGAAPSPSDASSVFPPERPLTLVEHALRGDRPTFLVILVLTPIFAWIWIVAMARDMYGPMTGASAWMMTTDWDAPHLLLLWAMWSVMMTAMMLPSAGPLILLYGAAARRSTQGAARQRTHALVAGYLAVWTAFSLAATALQRALAELLLVSPMMEASNSRVSGTLLILAGIYQLTPLKLACLRACQSPLGFLMSHWRNGSSGAFRLGLEHGAYCVGCCWALMLLLFAGGVMNLLVIVGLAAWVAVEKFAPFNRRGALVSGAVMIALGSWMLMRVEGTTVYLPVNHPGALLFLGDGHAAQGDGELTGDALETSMDIEFTVDLIEGGGVGHPLFENAEYLISLGVGGSLDQALQMATSGIMRWLQRDYKLDASEASVVLGFAMKYDVADLVGTQVSIAAKLPESALAKLRKAS